MTNKIVEGHGIPIRLDRYLRTINPTLTQGIIERYLRKGAIKVNDDKAKANVRVVNGDIIALPESVILSVEDIPVANKGPNAELLANKLLFEYLLYDHPDFYAFYKPSGLASQGGTRISTSLDDALHTLGLRLVHRLDKDTSGIMIAAKTRDAAIILTKAFAEQKIYKTYFACVRNLPQKPRGKVTSYLVKQNNFTGASYDTEVEGSKLAITEYEVVDSNNDTTLIKFTPQTGRMHQLRLHAKDLGCPIIGDRKYDGEENKYLMLHAYKMVLDQSIFGEDIIITAPLPEYFLVKL
jgi:23S rRNA pseudouridine955/2504/2580 synthase